MKYKNNNITYLAELTIRFIKENSLYNNFIKRTKRYDKTLLNFIQYNTLNSLLSFVREYAISGSDLIKYSEDSIFETKKYVAT